MHGSEVGSSEKTGADEVVRAHRNSVQTPASVENGEVDCGQPGGREVVML